MSAFVHKNGCVKYDYLTPMSKVLLEKSLVTKIIKKLIAMFTGPVFCQVNPVTSSNHFNIILPHVYTYVHKQCFLYSFLTKIYTDKNDGAGQVTE
jgi:hypothetical protein